MSVTQNPAQQFAEVVDLIVEREWDGVPTLGRSSGVSEVVEIGGIEVVRDNYQNRKPTSPVPIRRSVTIEEITLSVSGDQPDTIHRSLLHPYVVHSFDGRPRTGRPLNEEEAGQVVSWLESPLRVGVLWSILSLSSGEEEYLERVEAEAAANIRRRDETAQSKTYHRERALRMGYGRRRTP